MEWPACSPDLNPTEYLWYQLERAARARVIKWDAIPQQCVTKLVTSMRRTYQAVVAVCDT
uniref:Tc1-like transposase DDE domain-containing protein n=1 Tax=Oreochromis niloticus TaxID=8128 RepID=A0A669CTX7_ORENI